MTVTTTARTDRSDRRSRILMVDDSPTAIAAIRKHFDALGWQVDSVEHHLDIPRALRVSPPDLVILDLEMPGLSGERVSHFIRREQRRTTPIIVYSGQPVDVIQSAVRRIGAVAGVRKGNSFEEIEQAVRFAMEGRAAE